MLSRIKVTLLGSLLSWSCLAHAQDDMGWWNERHQWDGISPWVNYLTLSPKFMGPNALPVPEIRSGMLRNNLEVETRFGGYGSRGDNTFDTYGRVNVPLCNGRVALEGWVTALEYFETDTTTRDLRAARTRSGKGTAGGDIHFSTQVQLVKDKAGWPDLLLELTMRTASGTRLRDARYTDAPGYWFSVSAGKEKKTGGKLITAIRPYALLGFYSYQTHDVFQPQNDCLLYGAGIDLTTECFVWSHQWGGYAGYLRNGDQPMVYRSLVRFHSKIADVVFRLQFGLHDFEYRSLHCGFVWNLANFRKRLV